MNALTPALAETALASTLAPPGDDAELIRLCAEFDVLERMWLDELYTDSSDEREAFLNAAEGHKLEAQAPLLERIVTLGSTTPAGHRALARSVCIWDAERLKSAQDVGDELTTVLFRSLIGPEPIARTSDGRIQQAAPHPDADLLALRPEYDRLKAELVNNNNNPDLGNEDIGEPFDNFCMGMLRMPPAVTAEGLAFKARLVQEQHLYVNDGGGAHQLIKALLEEIIASVPPKAPASHPDAALLDLCARLRAQQEEWQRLYLLTSESAEIATDADREWQAYSDNVWPGIMVSSYIGDQLRPDDLAGQLRRHVATTLEGLRAKAAAIAALGEAGEYCEIRNDTGELLYSLQQDAAAGTAMRMGAAA